MIPYSEISKEGPLLHLAHANAYPFGCYTSFLKPFADKYNIIGMHTRAMWPDSAPSSIKNWEVFGDDLIEFFSERSFTGAIGIGHSMGAIYSLLAARKRPELFQKIIMIDPVILPPAIYYAMKMPDFIKKRMNPLMLSAERRKDRWNTKEEAIEYLKSKKVYQRFHPESFEDFVNHGLKEEEGTVRLAFPREWEAKIYSSVTNIWSLLKKPPCPLVIIRAQYSDVINDKGWEQIKLKTANAEFINFEKAGHLIPMEKPYELGKLIKAYL